MDIATRQVMLSKTSLIASWVLQILAATILFQTLFFKFTGAEESKHIFRTLGAEPWGRFGSGVVELITVVLLVIPKTVVLGAVLAAAVISGAIMSHLTKLGIEVQGDGGLLFALALTTFAAAGTVVLIRRRQLPVIGAHL